MTAQPHPPASSGRPAASLLTAFQPIIGLRDGQMVGVEALTRVAASYGPGDIRELIDVALADGSLSALERRCWSTALGASREAFGRQAGWCNLFLNVLPESLSDQRFLDDVLAMLALQGVQPAQIVVEITESSRIEDYSAMRLIVSAWRRMGFRFAVDDAGAGHSGLQTIVELQPDFVKADRSLVSGLHQHPARRAAIESLLLLARRMGIALVAEGIETEQELMELRRLGVPYGQGFFLGRPSPVPSVLPSEIRRLLLAGHTASVARNSLGGARLGDVLTPTPTVEGTARVADVADFFEHSRVDSVVITEGTAPVALLMRSAFHQLLAQRFGHELYWQRSVLAMAARHPLFLDARTTLDEAARAIADRAEGSRYDAIIVVRDDDYLGTVAVHRLLEALAEQRIANAREENPLTGLPGNPAIEAELRSRLDVGRHFAVLYVDLDWFKAFNDTYGVHHGDRAIRRVAHVLSALQRCEGDEVFLGHVGGDDFVLVCDIDQAPALEAGVDDAIPAELSPLYAKEDRHRGYLNITGRDGEPVRVPLATVTVAKVRVDPAEAHDVEVVLARLAAAKREQKAQKRIVAA